MRVILFIGHHKAGSSALQSYLAQNAIKLRRQGVLYPAIDPRGMRRMRTAALFDLRGRLHVNIREAHNALAFRMITEITKKEMPSWHANLPDLDGMMENIRQQITRYQPHTVVLVAEVFANFGLYGADPIAKLLSLFQGADLTITATLRRPDEYAVSWMAQRMRFGQNPRRLSDGGTHGGIHNDYRLMVEPWIKAAQGANICLVNYADVMAQGGAVRAFFAKNDLPLITARDVDRRSNPGIHRGLIEIVRRGNAKFDRSQSRLLFKVLLSLGPKLDLLKASEIEMFGAQQRDDIHRRFAPIHDYLSQISGKLFFPDFDDILKERPIPEATANITALEGINAKHLKAAPRDIREWLQQLDISEN